jgi:hypothetical protein
MPLAGVQKRGPGADGDEAGLAGFLVEVQDSGFGGGLRYILLWYFRSVLLPSCAQLQELWYSYSG